MNVLGIDTSTALSAACVVRDDGAAFESGRAADALLERPVHGRELLPAIADALSRSGLGFGDLDSVAVGVGPGAFTGLRIGVATARAIASAQGIPLRPVSSLRALASGIDDPAPLPLIDARRGELFALLPGHDEPLAAPPEEVARRALESGLDPLAAGEGAVRFRDLLETAGVRVAAPGSSSHLVRGRAICRLATEAAPVAPEGVIPDYRRLPDARPQ
jgi:tRNA threonylcarbamoyladenosine biosynthesis protein TsaB